MNFLFDITQPKVDNIWAYLAGVLWLICSVLAIANSNKIDSKYVWTLFGVSVIFAGIGAFVYTSTYKDIAAELKEQKEQCEKISKQREVHLIDSKRDQAIKDSCIADRNVLKGELEKVNDKMVSLKMSLNDEVNENKKLEQELKKYKAHKYKFYDHVAVVRDSKTGKMGYLKEGYLMSSIEFVYDDACRFSEGVAFVKFKGGGEVIQNLF